MFRVKCKGNLEDAINNQINLVRLEFRNEISIRTGFNELDNTVGDMKGLEEIQRKKPPDMIQDIKEHRKVVKKKPPDDSHDEYSGNRNGIVNNENSPGPKRLKKPPDGEPDRIMEKDMIKKMDKKTILKKQKKKPLDKKEVH
jgi:hypothetical protein